MTERNKSDAIEKRKKTHGRLLRKIKHFVPNYDVGVELMSTAKALLDVYDPSEDFDPAEVYNTAKHVLPENVKEIFNLELLRNSVAPIAVLRDTIEIYNVSPLNQEYVSECGIKNYKDAHPNQQCLIGSELSTNFQRDKQA